MERERRRARESAGEVKQQIVPVVPQGFGALAGSPPSVPLGLTQDVAFSPDKRPSSDLCRAGTEVHLVVDTRAPEARQMSHPLYFKHVTSTVADVGCPNGNLDRGIRGFRLKQETKSVYSLHSLIFIVLAGS